MVRAGPLPMFLALSEGVKFLVFRQQLDLHPLSHVLPRELEQILFQFGEPSPVQYDGSVSTSGRYPAILRSWQSSHVYVRKMPRASYWADFGLPDPHEHVFERHCLGMRVIFSSC